MRLKSALEKSVKVYITKNKLAVTCPKHGNIRLYIDLVIKYGQQRILKRNFGLW